MTTHSASITLPQTSAVATRWATIFTLFIAALAFMAVGVSHGWSFAISGGAIVAGVVAVNAIVLAVREALHMTDN
ncbi:MAG: hypothetical protein Q4P05_04325 [Actinomycetaceae bacterium]|nr:hypothetical protein [Actinomycetaceae bacterium]